MQTGPVEEAGRISVDFCVSVAQQFPPALQILACYKLVQHLGQLPQEKPTSEEECVVKEVNSS